MFTLPNISKVVQLPCLTSAGNAPCPRAKIICPCAASPMSDCEGQVNMNLGAANKPST